MSRTAPIQLSLGNQPELLEEILHLLNHVEQLRVENTDNSFLKDLRHVLNKYANVIINTTHFIENFELSQINLPEINISNQDLEELNLNNSPFDFLSDGSMDPVLSQSTGPIEPFDL